MRILSSKEEVQSFRVTLKVNVIKDWDNKYTLQIVNVGKNGINQIFKTQQPKFLIEDWIKEITMENVKFGE